MCKVSQGLKKIHGKKIHMIRRVAEKRHHDMSQKVSIYREEISAASIPW